MDKGLIIAVLVMGLSGLTAQVVLLRELLIVFSGNEFSIGIILGNWLMLEAVGSICFARKIGGSKDVVEKLLLLTVMFCISLIAAIFATRSIKSILGVSIGENVRLLPMFYCSFIVLFPVSFFHGALFPVMCHLYSGVRRAPLASVGGVYALETVGTVLGGMVSSFLLVHYMNSFECAWFLTVLNLLVCLAIWIQAPSAKLKKAKYASLGVALLAVLGLFLGTEKLHRYSLEIQWKNHNLVHYQNSHYGNICVIENQGQYIFFQDGVPSLIIPFPDMPSVEEFVHIPLLAHPEPRNVLIISGGAGGAIKEVLRHPSIQKVHYAELDPLFLEVLRKFKTPLTEYELNDPRVNVEHMDGRLFLNRTEESYDLILVGLGEPSSLQANRLFTKEFFLLARQKLRKDGIFVITLPGSLTYWSQGLKDLNKSIFQTLKSVLSEVRVLPGGDSNIFLGSESKQVLSVDKSVVLDRLKERCTETETMIPWYIEQKLHEGWQGWFSRFIEGARGKVNSDGNPVGVFY